MNIVELSFLFCFCLSSISAITSEVHGKKWLAYVFRPFTIILLIGFVLESRPLSFYHEAILLALVFSLLGDTMMMLKKKRFLAGLLFFLLAQAALASAFYSRLKPGFLPWPVWPLVLLAALMLGLIWKNLGKYKIPVCFYLLVILTMARLALELPHQLPGFKSWLAASGALFFLLSDAILAVNQFHRPFKNAQVLILSTFYLALLLLSLSI
ncbi:MAG: lysoplasmalogenase [Candidatus Aminicenantes bacterium]|nr:lysoplasmalogenase [Candidatus Aminicenantes bacterium]